MMMYPGIDINDLKINNLLLEKRPNRKRMKIGDFDFRTALQNAIDI